MNLIFIQLITLGGQHHFANSKHIAYCANTYVHIRNAKPNLYTINSRKFKCSVILNMLNKRHFHFPKPYVYMYDPYPLTLLPLNFLFLVAAYRAGQ